jgi:hypothetical protein
MYGICDECEADIPTEEHTEWCPLRPGAPVDYLIDGTPERGYCIFDAATGDRIVERGQYVQGFAHRDDALTWVAAQD